MAPGFGGTPTIDIATTFTNPQWVFGQTMTIPAGDPDVTHTFEAMGIASFITGGQPFTVHGVGFHMHTRGVSGRVGIKRQSGEEECLLDIPRWDFNWQGGYSLSNPATVNPGDGLTISCNWDNSPQNQPSVGGMPAAPRDLNWGEGTDDEMCLSGLFIVP